MLLVFFTFILILAFFFGDGGLLEIVKARSTIDGLKDRITLLEKERDKLTREIQQLKKNPMALEKKSERKTVADEKKTKKSSSLSRTKTGIKNRKPKSKPVSRDSSHFFTFLFLFHLISKLMFPSESN